MSDLSIPFNLSILDVSGKALEGVKPVRALDTFDGMSRNFHEDGLFSLSIFGKTGDPRRSRRFSYIDIKVDIFHPVIYRALVALKKFYSEIINGKSYAVWNEEIKDFTRSNALEGKTGFNFFVTHWRDIVFEERTSDSRTENIQLIEKYKDKAMLSKIAVLPAGLRDVIIKDGRPSMDEVNTFYHKVISISNSITSNTVINSIEMLDNSRKALQANFNLIFNYFETIIQGKNGMFLGRFAARKVFNGTRNVITSMDAGTDHFDNPANIGFNHTVIGLYQFIKATLPITKHRLRSGFMSKVFVGPNAPAFLVNKKTLKKEAVDVRPIHFDTWMTDEGLDKVTSLYGEESLRHKELEIEGYWVGLVYKGPDMTYKLFQDIDDLPDGMSRDNVTPITFTELIYLSVHEIAGKLPLFLTRYPVTGFGSIYPSKAYLQPTLESEVRYPLDDNWVIDKTAAPALRFPTLSDFVNSLSPHPAYLSGLDADDR